MCEAHQPSLGVEVWPVFWDRLTVRESPFLYNTGVSVGKLSDSTMMIMTNKSSQKCENEDLRDEENKEGGS